MLERQRAETQRMIASYEGQNELVNEIVSLTDQIADDPECARILEPYLLRIAEAEKKAPPPPQRPVPDSAGEDAE